MRLPRLCLLFALLGPCAMAMGADFSLSSPQVPANGQVPLQQVYQGFGCNGGDRSPALHWRGVPPGTRGFALTVFDLDAPGSGWWHWLVVNLPAAARRLPLGAGSASAAGLPAGSVQLRNDFGAHAYGGPCPPPGDRPHRYRFTLYALDTPVLRVPKDAAPAQAAAIIRTHAIARTGFTAYYGR